MVRSVVSLCFIVTLVAAASSAQSPGQRQYYADWKKHTAKNYYYRYYYYKKSSTDKEYAYHYGIYFPSRGKRVFMFNPESRKYWGVWEGEKYSLLAPEKQSTSIDEISIDDFPPPGAAPNIPGVDEKIAMIPPPNDFPKLKK